MDAQFETIEAGLQSFITQFQSELGVLNRIVHKNKNQHRRSSYFQYLLKVRRDRKLLQSSNLEEVVNSSFLVINGNRPKQKVQLLESLKRRKCDVGKHNFLIRLLGASRLLSQILLDVVLVFNMVSSLSQKQQSVKLNQEGIEVFREYYPKNEQEIIFLECVWETDKFVLIEKKSEPDNKNPNDDVINEVISTVEYQSVETILGDTHTIGDTNTDTDTIADKPSESKQVDNQNVEKDYLIDSEPSSNNQEHENNSKLLDHLDSIKPKPELKKKVAFVSIKRPEPPKGNDTGFPIKPSDGVSGKKEDLLFNLLSGGS